MSFAKKICPRSQRVLFLMRALELKGNSFYSRYLGVSLREPQVMPDQSLPLNRPA